MFALPCGSFLYTIVTYDIDTIINNILKGNLKMFGGIVFYGALIGGILGAIIGVRITKTAIPKIEKIVVPYIPIGHAIGRMGCVLAGCCYGMNYDGPFAIYYRESIAGAHQTQGYFPIQILEALINLGISFLLVKLRKKATKNFQLLSVYLILYGFSRFLLEFLRGDKLRGFYFSLSTSQWLSLGLILIGSIYLILISSKQKHKSA